MPSRRVLRLRILQSSILSLSLFIHSKIVMVEIKDVLSMSRRDHLSERLNERFGAVTS